MLSSRLGEPVVRGSFTIFPSEFLATQLEVSSMGIGLRFFHARASLMLIALAGSMSGEAAAAPPNGQPPLAVMIDHARVVKLPERTQTVIVGNPIIADVTVQRNGIMVVDRQELRGHEPHRARRRRHPALGVADQRPGAERVRRHGAARARARSRIPARRAASRRSSSATPRSISERSADRRRSAIRSRRSAGVRRRLSARRRDRPFLDDRSNRSESFFP